RLGGATSGNVTFNTGLKTLPAQPARLPGEIVPPDGGFGTILGPPPLRGFGDGTFNPPPLVEAADSGPFFHNNAVQTIEDAVAFYTTSAFNDSPAAQAIGGAALDPAQVAASAALLRVINALENVPGAGPLLGAARPTRGPRLATRLLTLAAKALHDAMSVLDGAGLHPEAVAVLKEAQALTTAQRVPEAIATSQAAVQQLRDP